MLRQFMAGQQINMQHFHGNIWIMSQCLIVKKMTTHKQRYLLTDLFPCWNQPRFVIYPKY